MRFAFPITKFRKLDDGRLEIEGLASDETIDSQGDIVDFDGLKRAAVHWRGNIREAHDPQKPVGRALEISFNDQERKMFVRSFVSAGAPETQAKVLDGTLRAYSVGGSNPTRVTYEKIGDLRVRRVHDWNMSELSLVDAPANPNANFELIKADGTATAALADDVLEAAAQKVANRFADAVLDALEKGKGGQAPPKGKGGQRPPARAAGDAETVEETKDGAGVTADFAETGFDAEAQRGGTGTGTDTMTGAKSPDVLTSSPDGKQSLAPKLPASGVEPAGAAPGTSQANVSPAVGADARTIVASAAAPTTAGQNADGPFFATADGFEFGGKLAIDVTPINRLAGAQGLGQSLLII